MTPTYYINYPTKDGNTLTVRFAPLSTAPTVVKSDIITFDIETSLHTLPDGSHVTYPYLFQFAINQDCYYTRNIDEAIEFFKHLKRGQYVYIHNASYEFAFIKSYFTWREVRSHRPNEIFYAVSDTFIVRCTYAISGKSLSLLASSTPWVSIAKQTGDIDHTILRDHTTPLTPREMRYACADVYILYEYIQGHTPEANTKTGVVRKAVGKLLNTPEGRRLHSRSKRMTYTQYRMYATAFKGGESHYRLIYRNAIKHTWNYDIASSYPYRLIANEYPISRPIRLRNARDEWRHITSPYIATVIYRNLRLKSMSHIPTISLSKCTKSRRPKHSNGRVLSAEALALTTTSLDIELIHLNYDYDEVVHVDVLYHRQWGLLPKNFRDYTLELYHTKTSLKGATSMDELIQYSLSKENINSLYGLSVTSPTSPRILYDNDSYDFTVDNSKQEVELYADSLIERGSKLPYWVGVWVAAYARYDLITTLLQCDPVYWDTDSCKTCTPLDIDAINAERLNGLLQIYSLDEVAPRDPKGNRRMIGAWEYEGECDIRAMGVKKYCCRYPDGHETLTVSGLNKYKAMEWLRVNNMSVFDIDPNYTTVPPEYSGRTTSEYINTPIDYTSPTSGEPLHINTTMNILPTSYTFNDIGGLLL